jgi:hypothetical protein
MQAELPSNAPPSGEDEQEIARRRDEIIRRMANTPPDPKTKREPSVSQKKRSPARKEKDQ